MTTPLLTMWVVYDHPTDCPDAFIARKWLAGDRYVESTDETMTETDIEDLRKYFAAAGWTKVPRHKDDDPVIVECWI